MTAQRQPYAYRKGPPRPRAARTTPEADFQRQVLQYLTYALPRGVYRVRGAMEGARRGYGEQGAAKGAGLSKGWPDLMLFNRQTRAIRWLELKADKGRMTPEQGELAAELRDHLAVCRTGEQVELALRAWGVPLRCSFGQGGRYDMAGIEPG